MARLENASFEEIVTHLERELELNGLEGGDEIPVSTMSTDCRYLSSGVYVWVRVDCHVVCRSLSFHEFPR